MNEDHPLKVHFPHGGIHYMLHYWSYDERGHIILSKSENGLRKIARKILSQSLDTEIKTFQKINIVAPSDDLCQKAQQLYHCKQVNNFLFEVTSMISVYFKKSRSLPIGFNRCKKYEYEFPHENEGYKLSSWDKEIHNGCKNCRNKISFSISKEELYEKYYSKWNKLFHPHLSEWKDNELPYSHAEKANENEILYRILTDFGHHADGLKIVDVLDNFEFEFDLPSLFFFHKLEELDYSEYVQFMEDLKKEEREKKIQSNINFKKEQAIERKNKLKQIRNLFKD